MRWVAVLEDKGGHEVPSDFLGFYFAPNAERAQKLVVENWDLKCGDYDDQRLMLIPAEKHENGDCTVDVEEIHDCEDHLKQVDAGWFNGDKLKIPHECMKCGKEFVKEYKETETTQIK